MINEERVKELYKAALYDSKDQEQHRQVGKYFRSDYISKELLKSFFSGTIAFGLMFVMWIVYHMEELLEQINSLDFVQMGITVGVFYVVFMLLYSFITWAVYQLRYADGRKELRKYGEHLKTVNKMYVREDKLKK